MTDSNPVEETLARNRRERREFIREWATYVRERPDADWGPQVNQLVDSQLAAARWFADERPDLDAIDSPLLED